MKKDKKLKKLIATRAFEVAVFFLLMFVSLKVSADVPARDFSTDPWVVYNGVLGYDATETDLIFCVPEGHTLPFRYSVGTYQGASDLKQASSSDDTICVANFIASNGFSYTGYYVGSQLFDTSSSTLLASPIGSYEYFNFMRQGDDIGYIKVFRNSELEFSFVTSFFNNTATSPSTTDPFVPETCDVGDIVCGIRNFFGSAFHLDTSAFNQFSNLKSQLENKAPFGYVTGVYDTITGLTSDADTGAYTLETITPIKNTIFDPIRSALIWILWFAFVFALYKQFKNITL